MGAGRFFWDGQRNETNRQAADNRADLALVDRKVAAADFRAAIEAYMKGDYATA